MQPELQELYQAIIDGADQVAASRTRQAMDGGLDPAVILNEGMVSAMGEVGRLFETGEYFVPEMLVSARAMQASLEVLRPALVQAEVKATGRVVIGTVKGDLHDIGKNLVCMMLEGASFEIIDLGTDVPPDKFVEAVRTHKPDLVGMSALLTTTFPNMALTIDALKEAGLRDQVKVMVGGAPLNPEIAAKLGADGTAADASQAVALARRLLGLA